MFLNLNALILLIVSICISLFLYKNELKTKLNLSVDFNQLLVLVITLGYAVVGLSNLTDVSKLGQMLSFIILANLYAGILNILVKIYLSFSNK